MEECWLDEGRWNNGIMEVEEPTTRLKSVLRSASRSPGNIFPAWITTLEEKRKVIGLNSTKVEVIALVCSRGWEFTFTVRFF